MIDDEWSPDRLQLRALGHLLIAAQNYPLMPAIRENQLYCLVHEREIVESDRQSWLDDLIGYGLVRAVSDGFRAGDHLESNVTDVCLTAAGVFYAVSRANVFAENARTPTDDFPQSIVDGPWAVLQYYAPSDWPRITVADDQFSLASKAGQRDEALRSIDAVIDALQGDNEIGDNEPFVRDEKLAELRAIRLHLESETAWKSKLVAAGWGALGYLTTHFADRPVGALAEQAWQEIQRLIGLS